MNTIIPFLIAGFMLGIQHSFDSDHLAAVSSILVKNSNKKISLFIGALWGIGHTITLFFIGLIVILFKMALPPKLSNAFEFLVGAMLLFLGAKMLWGIFVDKVHVHKHKHSSIEHVHFHSHKDNKNHQHVHKPLLIGMLHGLAGSAVIMLLVLSTVSSAIYGLVYIVLFGIGTMIGMALFSLLIGVSLEKLRDYPRINKCFMLSISFISLYVGANILVNNNLYI